MIEHTYDKTQYISLHGRTAYFMKRPPKTKQKSYRQPILDHTRKIKNKEHFEQLKQEWENC